MELKPGVQVSRAGWRKHIHLCWKPSPHYIHRDSRSNTQPLPRWHRHTHTHKHIYQIWAVQWFVHVNHALNGPWNRLRRGDSVSTLWIAKQIQLGLPVININNRLTSFLLQIKHYLSQRAKWIAAIQTAFIYAESRVECSGWKSLAVCVLLKAHKGRIAKLINIPQLTVLHMPRS